MKPAPFSYRCPETVVEAFALLGEYGDDAAVLAGGQSLVPLFNFRLAQPQVVVDINRLSALDTIDVRTNEVVLGALARASRVEFDEPVQGSLPVLRQALRHVGHPQIRNRTTIGGNIAHADPASELPAVLIAMQGDIVVKNTREERSLPADEFFLGWMTTAKRPDELVVSVSVPRVPDLNTTVLELARRRGDYAVVGLVCGLRLQNGVADDIRLTYFGVGSTPVRLHDVEAQLRREPIDDERIEWAASEASHALDPPDDVHGSSAYRRHVAAVLTRRALKNLSNGAVE